jgi:uncharacterized membrane protein YhaH (DUF805 family)/phage shock protein A
MNFVSEVQTNYVQVLRQYVDFNGRASRKQYWMYVLASLVIQFALIGGILAAWTVSLGTINLGFLSTIYIAATFLPSLGVGVRRLHDINLSGWWALIGLVPVAGEIGLLTLHCIKGTDGDNSFGPRPKEICMDAASDDLGAMTARTAQAFETNLKKLKDALVESITSEKQLEAELKKKTQEYESWETRARLAVDNGKDDEARQCLLKKNEMAQIIQALNEQLQSHRAASANIKEKHKELEEKFRSFHAKKSSMDARYKAAQAGASPGMSSSASAMDRWEEKVRAQEARNEATRDVAQASRQTAGATHSSEVEDELAALKRSVSGTTSDSNS